MKSLILFLFAILFLFSCAPDTIDQEVKEAEKTIQDGDIIFQSTNSRQCEAIKLATNSKYSHVGVIFKENNEWMVYEAVEPVKKTSLNQWIRHGENAHYVIKRLKNADEVLTETAITKMKSIGEGYMGKHYDLYFEWSDEKIYCSELVWKMYKEATGVEISALKHLSDFDLSSRIVLNIMEERYGDNVPLDEEVIAPAGLFNSKQLVLVKQN